MKTPLQVAQFIACWYYVSVYRPSHTASGAKALKLSYNCKAIPRTVGELSSDTVRPS